MHNTFFCMLHRLFLSGVFDENSMKNIDETHFFINMNNGIFLGWKGDITV